MARTATGYLMSDVPDGSTLDSLRASMVANLTQWTVGAVYKFGATTEERGYFTITHASGAEIMISMGVGTSSSYYDRIWSGKRTTVLGDVSFSFEVGFAPEGGYEAALANALDPINQSFFDYITGTLGLREASCSHPSRVMYNGSPSLDFTYVEDDASDLFTLYCWRTSAISAYYTDMFMIGTALVLQSRSDGRYSTEALITYNGNNSGTPQGIGVNYIYQWIEATGQMRLSINSRPEFYNHSGYTTRGTESSNLTGKVVCSLAALRGDYDQITGQIHFHSGHLDPDFALCFPRANNQVTAFGASTAKKYIQIFDGLASPWTNTLSNPTY